MKTAIHWFRRDLRVADSPAFFEATRRAEQVWPVFILEESLRSAPDVGAARLGFLLNSLASLRQGLLALGYPLIVRTGRSVEVIPALALELQAEAVFANKRPEPYAQARDEKLFHALNAVGIGFETFKDAVMWEEDEILTQAGKPFQVFTPYARVWRSRSRLRPVPSVPPASSDYRLVPSESLATDPAQFGHPFAGQLPPAGEPAARECWQRFLAGPVLHYAETRDYPAQAGTSDLSPHLRVGTIGIRTILAEWATLRRAVPAEGQGQCDVFLTELIWREFYQQILWHFPHVTQGAFRPEYNRLRWSQDRGHFDAWCAGNTGYPIIDAAMRCLNATGRMHNRLRMIVAMFLTKDLLLHWQWGERYFMQQLLDGDLAANNGGWQWSAGTGTDAAPYFRIFNPVTQAERFDPDGRFVREWIPELAEVPDRLIQQPWKYPGSHRYAARVVLHEEQRPKCLAMYKAVKG